jgi:hypothetical protein
MEQAAPHPIDILSAVESPACIELIDTWIDAEDNYKHDPFPSSQGTES